MPEITEQIEVPVGATDAPLDRLPFPPLTAQHILNCSYHAWQPRYRTVTPKARLVPLSAAFLAYLRADGIVLPPDADEPRQGDYSSDDDSGIFSATENPDAAADDSDDEAGADPSAEWRDVHQAVQTTIAELGGKVVPKLNWSAPKDATWINATNSMECRSANDVYLLLKSSDFVTHDLEHALDDCEDAEAGAGSTAKEIPYYLVLRKYVQLNPSLEFRCFVRNRRLLALCQRDLNHFDFLFQDNMSTRLRSRIQSFFDDKMRDSFPDPNFVFDVYVPPPHDKVWLIDVNPWAQRTDPLLWSWLELLTMDGPDRWEQKSEKPEKTVRIPLRPSGSGMAAASGGGASSAADSPAQDGEDSGSDTETPSDSEDDDDDDVDAELWAPELRLVRKDDPEAYGFATPQYSAHKLPRDVVDASRGGEGSLREFAEQWKEILAKRQKEDEEASDSDSD